MNANKITILVHNALASVDTYRAAIDGLRTAMRGNLSPKEVRVTLLTPVAVYYKVKLVAREKGEGMRLDPEAKQYEAAKKALYRLVAEITGGGTQNNIEYDVPADMLAMARKLVALAGQYEHAGKLVQAAIKAAKE